MTAYWIARITIHDTEGYDRYRELAGPAIEGQGGKFLSRGGRHQTLEGLDRPRNVLVEFPDFETAIHCYNSPEYQEALSHALPAAERDVVIIDGN